MKRTAQLVAVGGLALLSVIAAVVSIAQRERTDPARCPLGTTALGARCCGQGQQLRDQGCVGPPQRCPAGTRPATGPRPGCVAVVRRIRYRGGTLQLAPSDWEAQGRVEARVVKVGPFSLDSIEVTLARWQRCAAAGTCRPLPGEEPGRAVSNVSPDEARTFCRFDGGRLPTGNEWLLAAFGPTGRRFPWGPTGLVCRRAVFGLVDGPCGYGATGPELAGTRPDGATPEGALDLAGNVSEWTMETGGEHAARGGSYRSQVAARLKSWATEATGAAAPHIGFRCAYDLTQK